MTYKLLLELSEWVLIISVSLLLGCTSLSLFGYLDGNKKDANYWQRMAFMFAGIFCVSLLVIEKTI